MRPIGLAYVDSDLEEGQKIEIQYRGKTIQGLIVEKNLSSEAPPYAHPRLRFGEAGEKAKATKSERPGHGTYA